MKISFLAFAVLFFTASTFAQDPKDTSTETTTTLKSSSALPTKTTTPVSSTTSSSSTQTTISTSSVPTTTTTPTTPSSSSEATTLSSTSLETTTSSSSPTTTPTSTTTTPKTTTSHETTTAAPTSTETPITSTTPLPVPEQGYWNVTDGNTTCIRASLAIRFKLEIKDSVDYIVLSPTASTEGSKCNTSDGTEVLLLKEKEFNVIFVFEKKSDSVYVRNISFTYYLPLSTGTFRNDSQFFEVKSGNSYLCKTASSIFLSSDDIVGNATMEVTSIQIQAFGAEFNKDFGSAEECGADNPINDIVPIAVGVALLALVVVVLIAYLVGRRRSRQKGYQSV